MGEVLPTLGEILELAQKSKLLNDPYVKRVYELSSDTSLFSKSPDWLESLRKSLLRDALQFFTRHSRFYEELLRKLEIDPKAAELEDLKKLAVPSDMLRGEGYKKFLIDDVDEGGKVFSSSGTTGNTPVKVYRSPIELAMMTKANTALFEYVYGGELKEGRGLALFLAAEELRNRLNFVAFVDLALQGKKIKLLYGMDLVEGSTGGSQWQKLVPNKKRIVEFLKSKEEPKLLFTAPAGVYLLAKQYESLNAFSRLLYKLMTGTPPVNLGAGGTIVTGGGSKGFSDIPPYDKIVEIARKWFKAYDVNGVKEVPTPFMDVLGMTETLTALIDKYGVMHKIPHPLQHVFLLDMKTYDIIDAEGKEGILAIYDPLAISWLEVFMPGDVVKYVNSERYYGKEFIYVRRLTQEEGWSLQRACGGTLEEMMR